MQQMSWLPPNPIPNDVANQLTHLGISHACLPSLPSVALVNHWTRSLPEPSWLDAMGTG